jgi:putative flippase GtrA
MSNVPDSTLMNKPHIQQLVQAKKKQLHAFFSHEFIRFLITGGIAACVNFLSRIFYNQYVSFSSAVFIAYLTGMATAFFLKKQFVFVDSQNSLRRSAFFFVLVNMFALAQTWLVSMGMRYYGLPALGVEHFVPEIASAIGIAFPVYSSFMGHKYLSFKK